MMIMRKYSFCIGHYFSRTLVIFEVFLIKQINLIMSAKNTILWEYFTAWKSDDSLVKFNLQNNKALIVLVSKLRLTILYISQEKLPTKISYFQPSSTKWKIDSVWYHRNNIIICNGAWRKSIRSHNISEIWLLMSILYHSSNIEHRTFFSLNGNLVTKKRSIKKAQTQQRRIYLI